MPFTKSKVTPRITRRMARMSAAETESASAIRASSPQSLSGKPGRTSRKVHTESEGSSKQSMPNANAEAETSVIDSKFENEAPGKHALETDAKVAPSKRKKATAGKRLSKNRAASASVAETTIAAESELKSKPRKTDNDVDADKPAVRESVDAKQKTRKRKAQTDTDAGKSASEESVIAEPKKKRRAAKSARKAPADGAGEISTEKNEKEDEEIETVCTKPWGEVDSSHLKIVSWNVCSLRSILKTEHFFSYIKREEPDIVLLQETKMTTSAESEVRLPEGYVAHFLNSSARQGYSGVGVLVATKQMEKRMGVAVTQVSNKMGDKEADAEGRVQTVRLNNGMVIVGAYVPNAGGKLQRLGYRTEVFEPRMRAFLDGLKKETQGKVVYCGDLNVAHEEIDIHESKRNAKSAGHTPQERAEFGNLLKEGWVDVFRQMRPRTRAYTYFSRRFGERLKKENKGWRLDYHVVPQIFWDSGDVRDCYIRYDVEGSDHVPVVLIVRTSEP